MYGILELLVFHSHYNFFKLFIHDTGIHLFLPKTNTTYLLITSLENYRTRNFSVSLHTCYPLSYSHITSNFVFTRSLISIVDYRFHHYLFLCRQCLRPSLPFKFVASRLQSLFDIVIPCVIVFVFSQSFTLLLSLFIFAIFVFHSFSLHFCSSRKGQFRRVFTL